MSLPLQTDSAMSPNAENATPIGPEDDHPDWSQLGRDVIFQKVADIGRQITGRSLTALVISSGDQSFQVGPGGQSPDEILSQDQLDDLLTADFVDLPDASAALTPSECSGLSAQPLRGLTLVGIHHGNTRIGALIAADRRQSGPLTSRQGRELRLLATLTSELIEYRTDLDSLASDLMGLVRASSTE